MRSLNRAWIMALPGVGVSDDILGKSGYELLSSETLRREILASAPLLGLDPRTPDPVRALDHCFERPQSLPVALRIARSFGQRLGYFLVMLKRGDLANRTARPEWSDEHWAFWAGVERMVVGGGLMSGPLGVHAVASAREVLADNGASLQLERSPYGAYLALLGLARFAPSGVDHMLVLDFGQTSVKRGMATYAGDELARVEAWPSAQTVCSDIYATDYTAEQVRERWAKMLDIIGQGWLRIPPAARSGAGVAMSVASYLLNGHPSPLDRGCFGCLQLLGPNLEQFIRQELSTHLRHGVPLVLEHDGAAAAAFYAGSPRTVVLALGTAIGNGFPPPEDRARPLAPNLWFALLP